MRFPLFVINVFFCVLKAIKIPEGVFALVNSMYTDVTAFAEVDGSPKKLFDVRCGVLTGCPCRVSFSIMLLTPSFGCSQPLLSNLVWEL